MQQDWRNVKKKFRLREEVLAHLPFLGSGIFSLTTEQLLLLWNSKDRIKSQIEMDQRAIAAKLSPEKVKSLALNISGSQEEAESARCNYYHSTYSPQSY